MSTHPTSFSSASHSTTPPSVLAWSALQRVLAVCPALLLLWLAVGWALQTVGGA